MACLGGGDLDYLFPTQSERLVLDQNSMITGLEIAGKPTIEGALALAADGQGEPICTANVELSGNHGPGHLNNDLTLPSLPIH